MCYRVGRTGIKTTGCNFWLQVKISICKFWSTFCPKTNDPLIFLYVKWVFSGGKSSSLNIQNSSWRWLDLSGRHYLRKFLQVSRITCIFYYLWPMIPRRNLTYIVYRKYFRVGREPIIIGSVHSTRIRLTLWIPLAKKVKAYFCLQLITR